MRSFEGALRVLHDASTAAKARYALIGGIGISVWARPRATLDIDAMVAMPLERVAVLRQELARRGARIQTEKRDPELLMAALRASVGGTPIDVLASPNPAVADLLANRKRRTVAGVKVWVMGAEELVILKLQSGRAIDIEDAAAIVRERAEKLDRRRVETLAETFDVIDGWRALRPQP